MLKMALANICLFIWYRIVGSFFRMFPIDDNKIVFSNFYGKGYGENPKYIAEKLLENKSTSLKIIWLIRSEVVDDFPQAIQIIKRGSLKELYHLSTARVWVDNCRKHFGVQKRKNQYYMQTWHGSIYFKRIEKDAKLNVWYRTSAKHDSKMIDILISSSKWQTEQYKRCFWYDGAILEIGLPRNDLWAEELGEITAVRRKVCDTFQVNEQIKIALYAPTFRNNDSLRAYDMDYLKLVASLERYWGGEWVVLIRLHPNIERKSSMIIYSENVINASHYSDMNQLLAISDLLITDYSSCLFDAVYIEKPCMIYATDMEEYEKVRGFVLPLAAAPVLRAKDNRELEIKVREFDLSKYKEKCRKFSEEYGIIHNAEASKKAADWIINIVTKNAYEEKM